MRETQRTRGGMGLTRIVLSSLLILGMTAAGAHADVIVTATNVSVEAQTQGGGGATPVSGGDSDAVNSLNGNASASASHDTGNAVAEDGTGAFRGTGRGVGNATVSATLNVLTLSGSGTSSGDFEATPDLGTGLGSSEVDSEVLFKVTGSPVNYTFSASLTGDFESPDQVQLRRLDAGVNGVPVHLCNNIITNVNTSGTLQPGVYRLFTDIKAFESGGSAQSPGSESVSYSYSLEFEAGTLILLSDPQHVPASSTWALLVLTFVALGTAAFYMRRRSSMVA